MKSFFVVVLLLGVVANVVGCAGMSEIDLINEAHKTGDWTKVNNRLNAQEKKETEKGGKHCGRNLTAWCDVRFGDEQCTCAHLDSAERFLRSIWN